MKIRILIFVLLITFILSACSFTNSLTENEMVFSEYAFIGESEHWQGEFRYEIEETWTKKKNKSSYSNKDNYEFILKYKGSLEQLSTTKNLEFIFETKHRKGGLEEVFTEKPNSMVFTDRGSSSNGVKVNSDEIIKVIVKWDDSEEIFELTNKK